MSTPCVLPSPTRRDVAPPAPAFIDDDPAFVAAQQAVGADMAGDHTTTVCSPFFGEIRALCTCGWTRTYDLMSLALLACDAHRTYPR